MDLISHFTKPSLKTNAPELRSGDTVRVHQKIREGNKERIQVFEGVVISVRGGKAINSSFVVRRIASGVGVERTFPLHSPNVVKVERVKSGKVRQARLFYMRQRFGRNARLRGETATKDLWEEVAPVAEAEDTQTDAPEEVETIIDNTEEAPVEETQEVADAPAETDTEAEAPADEAEAPAEDTEKTEA